LLSILFDHAMSVLAELNRPFRRIPRMIGRPNALLV
jgi:hypothetical protein